VITHPRRDCWLQKSKKYELRVSVLYTPDLNAAQRLSLEKEFRIRLTPPCGGPVQSNTQRTPKPRKIAPKSSSKKRVVSKKNN
jgi:hypothetical protein